MSTATLSAVMVGAESGASSERRIRAIRLFQDQSGWTPHYTDSGVDKDFQPLCFGPAYVSAKA